MASLSLLSFSFTAWLATFKTITILSWRCSIVGWQHWKLLNSKWKWYHKWHWDFMSSYGKTSYSLVTRVPGCWHIGLLVLAQGLAYCTMTHHAQHTTQIIRDTRMHISTKLNSIPVIGTEPIRNMTLNQAAMGYFHVSNYWQYSCFLKHLS